MAKKEKKEVVEEVVEEEAQEEPVPESTPEELPSQRLDYKVVNTGRGRVKQYFDGRVEPY